MMSMKKQAIMLPEKKVMLSTAAYLQLQIMKKEKPARKKKSIIIIIIIIIIIKYLHAFQCVLKSMASKRTQ